MSQLSEIEIWKEIRKQCGNVNFTAALMAHMKAESALKSTNLQNSYEKKLMMTDATYTDAVDQKRYDCEKFAHDSAGYGLCQWTFWSRKAMLWDFCFNGGYPSIGDTLMQIDFAIYELSKNYSSIWNKRFEMNLLDAVTVLHKQYERPADQSAEAIQKRYAIAEDLLKKYHDVMPDRELEGSDTQSIVLNYLKSIKEDVCELEKIIQGRL